VDKAFSLFHFVQIQKNRPQSRKNPTTRQNKRMSNVLKRPFSTALSRLQIIFLPRLSAGHFPKRVLRSLSRMIWTVKKRRTTFDKEIGSSQRISAEQGG
jgi:hypothetical protein